MKNAKLDLGKCAYQGCMKDAAILPELRVPRKDTSLSTRTPDGVMLGMLKCCDDHYKTLDASVLVKQAKIVTKFLSMPGAIADPYDFDRAFLVPVSVKSSYAIEVKATADAVKANVPDADSVLMRRDKA